MSTDAVLANRQARLRWVGAPLLVSGVVLAGWAIHTSIGGGTLWNVGLGMLGCRTRGHPARGRLTLDGTVCRGNQR